MTTNRTSTYRGQNGFNSMWQHIGCHNGNHVFLMDKDSNLWRCAYCTATATRDGRVINREPPSTR